MKVALPTMIKAANASPPVEIVIINYNSDDDLDDYIKSVTELIAPNTLVYKKYTGRKYFHMAHSKNLAVLSSSGEYIVTMGADILLDPQFISFVRAAILKNPVDWLSSPDFYCGVIVFKREEFIEAGGYDERFEFYGPEDRDMIARMRMRGGKFEMIPHYLISEIPTSNIEKVRNYRGPLLNKTTHSRRMRVFYEENKANNVLVANAGKEWGQE